MTSQHDTEALLPCPFCGGKALLTEKKHYSLVNCGSIHCDMDSGCKAQRTQDAIAAWNTRAQPQQPAEPPRPELQPQPSWLGGGEEAVAMAREDGLLGDDAERARQALKKPAPELNAEDGLRERVRNAIATALGDAYDCLRVWQAWHHGTMGPDDFSLITEDDERLDEITDAAIKAMAAAPTEAVRERGNTRQQNRSNLLTDTSVAGTWDPDAQGRRS